MRFGLILILVLLPKAGGVFLRLKNGRAENSTTDTAKESPDTVQRSKAEKTVSNTKRHLQNQTATIPTRSLDYWDLLRNSTVEYDSRQDSALYKITLGEENTVRLAHLVLATTFTFPIEGEWVMIDTFAHLGGAYMLALHHFNERNSSLVPNLSSLLGDCNVQLTMDVRDTALSPTTASRKAFEYLGPPNHSLASPFPVAFIGAGRSATSEALSVLAGSYNTLVISSQSTASSLDNKDKFPSFCRAIPTNRVDSKAVVAYFKSLGVTHFGIVYIRDPYGSEYNRDLSNTAKENNMTVVSVAWDESDDGGQLISVLRKLRDSGFKYFFAILAPSVEKHKLFVQSSIGAGLMGGSTKCMWLFADSSNILREDGFYATLLDSSDESDRQVAAALYGVGLVVLHFEQNTKFNQLLREYGMKEEYFGYYRSRFESPEMFITSLWEPVPNYNQLAAYDSIMSLGIGLCSLENEFPTPKEVVEAVKNVGFNGSGGFVSYDNHTGTRSEESVRAEVINLLVDISEDTITPSAHTSALVNVSSQEVEVVSPFLFSDGSSKPPPVLPPLTVDVNLVEIGARAFGWAVAGFIILLSVYLSYNVFRYRKKNIIMMAQPVFLCLLCLGAAFMASAIIPMSFQEPMSQKSLDGACQAIPWLFIMGFATAFSSLYCKLRRINKVFRDSAGMRHVQVKAKDVILPFAVLITVNFVVLLVWTLVAPLRWSRVKVAKFDEFERSIESYGTCFSTGESSTLARNVFLVTLGVINFCAVVLANYQCYLSRNVPSDFNESFYIGLSMMSILEGFLLGVPIIFLTTGKPTAQYVTFSVLVFLLCMGILLPSIGSKMFVKHKNFRLRTSEWKRAWRDHDEVVTKRRVSVTASVGSSSKRRLSVASGGSSSTRDFARRPSMRASALQHQSSVAEIRARVMEKQAAQKSTRVPAVTTEVQRT